MVGGGGNHHPYHSIANELSASVRRNTRSTCPRCGSAIAQRAIHFTSPFRCPACTAELCVPRSYSLRSGVIGLALAVVGVYLVGPSAPLFPFVCLAAWFPAAFVTSAVLRCFLPPRPELWRRGAGDHLTRLYLEVPSDQNREEKAPGPSGAPQSDDSQTASGRKR